MSFKKWLLTLLSEISKLIKNFLNKFSSKTPNIIENPETEGKGSS